MVALTTSRSVEDVETTYDLGVNSYITKPVEMDSFLRTLEKLGNYWFQTVLLPPA